MANQLCKALHEELKTLWHPPMKKKFEEMIILYKTSQA